MSVATPVIERGVVIVENEPHTQETQQETEKRSKRCKRCGRKLKSQKSQELGFGDVCFKKHMAETRLIPLFKVKSY